ncbi:exodeoxyribonuclease VII small subunit [Alphaproteobacteria bacterium]|nr:exodeoxyribonuclease VII small subunit [Alphaproteobacteria bacterium]
MNKKKENNFESALNRLEEISDLLENEDTPLEDSIKLFEEGIELKEFCEEKLKSAKIKIDKIVKKNKSLSSSEFK